MNNERQLRTYGDVLRFVTTRYGDQPAVSTLGEAGFSYADVGERAAAVAVELSVLGVRKGERVALISENRPEWPIWYLGIVCAGAVVVPILTDFHQREVANILDHCRPSLVIASSTTRRLVEGSTIDVLDIADLRTLRGGASEGPGGDLAPDDLAAIIYTSGTTGTPKGVMLTHENIVSNAQAAYDMVPIYSDDRLLSILPLAHSYEWTIGFMTPFLGGARITYLGGPPTISRLLPAFESVRPTIVLSVPLILEKIYHARVLPIFRKLPGWLGSRPVVRRLIHRIAVGKLMKQFGGKLRFFGVGGAALSVGTERFLSEGRFPYAVGYGLTETSPLLAGASVKNTRFRATGPSLSGVSLRIQKLDNDSENGEIQARGPNVMKGYYKNPEATAEAFTQDGWFKTGDLGNFGTDGYLYIKGRAKTVIVGPSGENIYPEEIEAEIDTEPLVEESLVLSYGGKLVARVRLNVEALAEQIGNITPDIDVAALGDAADDIVSSIRQSVNQRLNHFSRLADVILQTDALERTPTRKIKRFLYHQDDRQATI